LVFIAEFKQVIDIGIVLGDKNNDIVAAQIKAGWGGKLRSRRQDYQPGKQGYITQQHVDSAKGRRIMRGIDKQVVHGCFLNKG
jgi:hypothetical protein